MKAVLCPQAGWGRGGWWGGKTRGLLWMPLKLGGDGEKAGAAGAGNTQTLLPQQYTVNVGANMKQVFATNVKVCRANILIKKGVDKIRILIFSKSLK